MASSAWRVSPVAAALLACFGLLPASRAAGAEPPDWFTTPPADTPGLLYETGDALKCKTREEALDTAYAVTNGDCNRPDNGL